MEVGPPNKLLLIRRGKQIKKILLVTGFRVLGLPVLGCLGWVCLVLGCLGLSFARSS